MWTKSSQRNFHQTSVYILKLEKGRELKENLIHGRFLAELTKEVFEDLRNSKYQHAEYRISIYGSRQEKILL